MGQDHVKKVFLEAIDAIMKQYERDSKFQAATQDIDLLSCGMVYDWYKVEKALINTLQALVGKPDDDTIEWWIYETDFGNNHPHIGEIKNNFLFVLETPEDLYNYLTDNTDDLKTKKIEKEEKEKETDKDDSDE